MKIYPVLFVLFLTQVVFGQGNPFVRDIYTADPSAHVWEDGRLYVYPSHDIAPPRGCDLMDKYHVYSTDDMIHWIDHGQILEAQEVPWGQPLANNATFMWAPDCAYLNGKYYFYFPHPDKDPWNSNWKIGIAVSDRPASDFTVLPEPLKGLPESGEIDPCIFVDDDGQAYFYYGGGNRCFGAKLKDNGIELDGALQSMTGLYDFHEATWVFKRNGIYYLTYADNHSGANQLRYATSAQPLGPWSHKGVYLRSTTSDTSHGSVVEYQGQWWAFYHTADLSGTGLLRSICVDPLDFNDDGTIRTVVQTKDMGSPYLGILRTSDESIEAENFNSGGQGIAYWSNRQGINTGVFRKNEDIVILENRRDQMYYINGTSSKEYINYTVEILETGVYDLEFTVAAVSQSLEVQFYIDWDWSKNPNPTKYTAPYAAISNMAVVTVPGIALSQGVHTLNFYPLGNLNFDKFRFKKRGTSLPSIPNDEISLYPNPSDGLFHLLAPSPGVLTLYDSRGSCLLKEEMKDVNHTLNLSGYVPGIYRLSIRSGAKKYQTTLIKK
ncbi:MAG: family 43 glycosylhydrolase [Dysgonamonadaceae bacterium]|nr:family 43 glycosylhydrolase [Dysgonamonadaceae bacterium]